MSRPYQSHEGVAGVSDSQRKLRRFQIPEDLSGQRVLDIGCNEGFFCAEFARRGAKEVIGLDRHAPSLAAAQERYGDLPIKFVQQSWDSLPAGQFDLILWSSAMHYTLDPKAVLSDIFARLSPNGLFVLECGVRDTSRKEVERVQRFSDSRWYPSMPYLLDELLDDFSVRRVTQGEVTEGDPVPRFVFHCRRPIPTVMVVRGKSNQGKTAISHLLSRSSSKTISLDLFIGRMMWAKHVRTPLEKLLKEQTDRSRLDLIYERIDEHDLTSEYVEFLAEAIAPSDRLVIIEGFMTDRQYALLEERLAGRAVLWHASRSATE